MSHANQGFDNVSGIKTSDTSVSSAMKEIASDIWGKPKGQTHILGAETSKGEEKHLHPLSICHDHPPKPTANSDQSPHRTQATAAEQAAVKGPKPSSDHPAPPHGPKPPVEHPAPPPPTKPPVDWPAPQPPTKPPVDWPAPQPPTKPPVDWPSPQPPTKPPADWPPKPQTLPPVEQSAPA